MKKLVAVLLVMTLLALTGCGGGGTDMTEMDVPMEESEVLYSKLTGYRNEPGKPFALRVELENQWNRPQLVTFENCTINDYQIDPDWEIVLEPKENKTVVIEWPEDKFAYSGVELGGVKEIYLMTRSYEADDVDKTVYAYEWGQTVTIDDSKPWTYTDIDGFPMVLDRNELQIVVLGFEEREEGLAAKLHVENLGETAMELEMLESKVNGVPCDGEFSCHLVQLGSTAITDLFFSNEALEQAGIEKAETVEWTIKANYRFTSGDLFTETMSCDVFPLESAE